MRADERRPRVKKEKKERKKTRNAVNYCSRSLRALLSSSNPSNSLFTNFCPRISNAFSSYLSLLRIAIILPINPPREETGKEGSRGCFSEKGRMILFVSFLFFLSLLFFFSIKGAVLI